MLSPEQEAILQAVLDPAAFTGPHTSIPLSRAREFISKVTSFVTLSCKQLGQHPYMLVLATSAPESVSLCWNTTIREVNSGRPVLLVDEDLHFVESIRFPTPMAFTDCEALTKDRGSIGVLVNGSYVHVIAGGSLVREWDVVDPTGSAPGWQPCRRPFREFARIQQDHLERWVYRQMPQDYWHNRRNRILCNGTELVFHNSLYCWLDLFVADKLRIYGDATGHGQDKTDITVITVEGAFVIEIKWLGTNGTTRYGKARIHEGVKQVGEYLDRDPDLRRGYLVIYDGRSQKKHDTESDYHPGRLHERCEEPFIHFLPSETPSEVARHV